MYVRNSARLFAHSLVVSTSVSTYIARLFAHSLVVSVGPQIGMNLCTLSDSNNP